MEERSRPWCPNGCMFNIFEYDFFRELYNNIGKNMAIGETVGMQFTCPVCGKEVKMSITLEPTFRCWIN